MTEDLLTVEECNLYQAQGFTVGSMAVSEKLGKLCVVRKLDCPSKKRIPLNILEFWNVFDCPNIFLERQIPFDGLSIEAVTWKNDLVYCACTDGSAYVVSPNLSKKTRVQVCPSALWCCASSAHSDEVFFGSDSGYVFGVSLNEEGHPVARQVLYIGLDRRVLSLACAFKSNTLKIAVGMVDRIEIHAVVSAGSVPVAPVHIDIPRKHAKKPTIVWSLQFINNHVLVSGDSQGLVTFWNSISGAAYKMIPSHQADILCLVVSNDGKVFASGVDHRIQVISGLSSGEKQFDWSTIGQRLIHEIDVRSMAVYGMYLISGGAEHHLTVSSPQTKVHTPIMSKCSVTLKNDYMMFTYPRYVEVWKRGKAHPANAIKDSSKERQLLHTQPMKLAQLYCPKSEAIVSSSVSPNGRFIVVAGSTSLVAYEVNLQPKGKKSAKKGGAQKAESSQPIQIIASYSDVAVTAMCMTAQCLYFASGDFELFKWRFGKKEFERVVESNGNCVLRTLTVSNDDSTAVAMNCRSQIIVFENLPSKAGEENTPTFRSINLNSVPKDCRFLSKDSKLVVVLNACSQYSISCIDLATGTTVGAPLSADSLFPLQDNKTNAVYAISDVSAEDRVIVTSSSGAYIVLTGLQEKERTVLFESAPSKYRSKCPALPFWGGSSLAMLCSGTASNPPSQVPFKVVRYDRM